MTDPRVAERAARMWLEEGPTKAPDQAIEAALLKIESTRQDRRWPFAPGNLRLRRATRALVGGALVMALFVAGLLVFRQGLFSQPAAVATPSPTPSALPTSSEASVRGPVPPPTAAATPPVLISLFVSPRNGYSIQYPGDWIPTPATATWEIGAANRWGSPALDQLLGLTARFAGTSQALGVGQTPEQWIAAYGESACLGGPDAWLSVPIGGATGMIDADGCVSSGGPSAKGGPLFDAVVIVNGRAYNFAMSGELSHADFVAVLATVTLDPAAASPASAP